MEFIKVIVNREKGRMAYGLLITWCLLPIIMVFYCTLIVIADVPFVALGWTEYDFVVPWYSMQVNAFLLAFYVLGGITLLFSIVSLVSRRKDIFTRDQLQSHPWMLLLLLLFIWMLLSTILADDPVRAFTGSTYLYNGMGAYIVFAGVFICAASIREEAQKKALLRLFCGVIAFLSILIIIQAYSETVIDSILMPDLAAVFNQHNHFGYVLCMAIIGFAALYLFDDKAGPIIKALYLCGLCIDLLALLLNTTFGAYLAALIALPVIYIFYIRSGRKMKTTALLPVLVFLILFAIDCYGLLPTEVKLIQRFQIFFGDVNMIATNADNAIDAGTGRGVLWKQTIVRITQRPVFGFGPDGFYDKTAILQNDGVTPDHPHNEFLQMAGYSGIPALLFYLGALIALAVHHWKRLKELSPMVVAASGVTVTYLFSSFFGNPVFNTAPYFFLFLGLIAGTEDTVEDNAQRIDFNLMKALLYFITCITAASALLMFSIVRTNEKINEVADLQALNNAQLTVQSKDKTGDLVGTEFWYDANTFKLIPVTEPMPAAYGRGTRANANVLMPFNWQYDTALEYDGTLDYTHKIIKVNVSGTGGDLKVGLEWIPVK